MKQYIPKVKPRRNITKTENSHCGIYCLDNVISAYSDIIIFDPKQLHKSYLGRKLGWTLPWDMKKILAGYQLESDWKSARKTENKCSFLETLIEQAPVIIRIDLIDKDINSFKGKLVGHWIVLWGYSAEKKEFYTYDSRKINDQKVLVGNCSYSYHE